MDLSKHYPRIKNTLVTFSTLQSKISLKEFWYETARRESSVIFKCCLKEKGVTRGLVVWTDIRHSWMMDGWQETGVKQALEDTLAPYSHLWRLCLLNYSTETKKEVTVRCLTWDISLKDASHFISILLPCFYLTAFGQGVVNKSCLHTNIKSPDLHLHMTQRHRKCAEGNVF